MSTDVALRIPTVLVGTYEADLAIGAKIREAAESLQFSLGDWVNEMQDRYEDSQRSLSADLSRTTGVPAKTLAEYAKVARAFTAPERSGSMSFSHHLRAAAAEHPVQVLATAEAAGLSVRDTARLAQGLPTGGEDTAQKESSTTVQGASMEEAALEAIANAERSLATALQTVQRPGFRLTIPVGQALMQRLEAVSRPFVALEEAIKAEVGAFV